MLVGRRRIGLVAYASGCHARVRGEHLRISTTQIGVGANFLYFMQENSRTYALGGGIGTMFISQAFRSSRLAPTRQSFALHLDAAAALTQAVSQRWFLAAQLSGQVYFYRETASPAGRSQLAVSPVVALLVGSGYRF